MNNIVITIVLVLCSFLFVVCLTNTITIYAQQQMPRPSSSNTPPQIPSQSPSSTASPKAVKIISPAKGQQIPVGKDLTISGTSIDNAASNCQVSMSVNRVRPYQPATAAGTGGANDYSKWNFVLTPNYTTIKPGPDNRITAKYTCTDNSVVASPTYSSVNVTGVMDATSPTTTPTANVLQQQKQQTMTTSNNATIIGNSNPNKITPQGKPSLTMGNNNTNAIVNSVSAHVPPPASTPTNTPGSGELLYLGINSKSANKADDTNTKSTVAHHSSNDDSSSSNDHSGSKVKVHKVRDSDSDGSSSASSTSSSSSDDDVGNKVKVNKVRDSDSDGSSSASSTSSSSSDDDVGNKVKVNKVRDSDSDGSSGSSSASSSSNDHSGSKVKVHKVRDSDSDGSSSASSASSSSNDGGGVIDSEFGHSNPLSDALDAMSNTLDHLFG
jgi:hypothetical protein